MSDKTKTVRSRGNGDAIAKAMAGLTPAQVKKAMSSNGLGKKLGHHYGKLNNGRFRMVVGNSLRAMVHNGTPVTINGITVSKL